MSLLEDLHTARKARLVRLGTIPGPRVDTEKVRELENRLTEVREKLSFKNEVIQGLRATIDRQREVIQKFADEGEVPVARMNDILVVVGEHFNLSRPILIGDQRAPNIVRPRHIAYYLMRMAGYSFPNIGKACGNRDHTTILSGAGKIELQVAIDLNLKGQIETLQEKLRAYAFRRVEIAKEALA